MVKRHNVYEHANDLHVRNVIVYANESNVLFYDEAFDEKAAVMTTEVEDLFLKGVVVATKTGYVKPVAIADGKLVTHDAKEFTATAPVEE